MKNEDEQIVKVVVGLLFLAGIGTYKGCEYLLTSKERPVVQKVYSFYQVTDKIIDKKDKRELLNGLGIEAKVENDEAITLTALPGGVIDVYAQKDPKDYRKISTVEIDRVQRFLNQYPESPHSEESN